MKLYQNKSTLYQTVNYIIKQYLSSYDFKPNQRMNHNKLIKRRSKEENKQDNEWANKEEIREDNKGDNPENENIK